MGLSIDLPTELGNSDAGSSAGRGSTGTGTVRGGLDRIRRRDAVDRFVRWVETWTGT